MKTIKKMTEKEKTIFFENTQLFEISVPLKNIEIDLLLKIYEGNYVEIDIDEYFINNLCEKGILTYELELTFIGSTIIERILEQISEKVNNNLTDIEYIFDDIHNKIPDLGKLEDVELLESLIQQFKRVTDKMQIMDDMIQKNKQK